MLSLPLFALASALITLVPQVAAQTCNATSLCSESAPCCSEYGFCGSDSFCLGGCEPLYSYQTTSCRPDPICVSLETDFTDLSRVNQNASDYTGKATAWDWVINSGTILSTDDGARLILTQDNGGTKISSTRYMIYGTVDFVLETSKWAGVVTAAITMSDVKDEIDWEWPGATTDQVQTNYWYLGVANYSATEGASSSVSSDTASNFHTYSFEWTEDYINWNIDGSTVRTVQKTDTLSSDGSQYKFPSTPSRIQISIWPAGTSDNAQGTIDWAGGMINWDDSDYVSNGYFWNTVKSVRMTCGQDEMSVGTNGTTGWVYGGNGMDGVPTVTFTNETTLLTSSATQSSPIGLKKAGMLSIVVGAMVVLGGANVF
ncbi:hypothetical protein L198_06444 [Cryptococcus wingfieldii CBS 7118]|uniref:GH16 domain-containing protein n=1 Tax=Cryptococcus wingfieldii CBS 7118 TaxID=1295528 RepID=A0A1E3IMB7_9TREE|nr:hypothetical protein L198_06444 [Cryptococcus wingfieldii CBS 7118]ODN89750.1 hypothetical protein L198_06444 [Cryptococcus wingfieldii CBS 7118]